MLARIRISGAVIGIAAMLLSGCESGVSEDIVRPDADAMSPADYFDATHKDMPTPSSGDYVSGSAADTDSGKIRINTSDGSTLEMTATRDGDGYRYRDTRRVDP